MASDSSRLPLWTLLLGNFVIGTGVLLPTGMLDNLSADLGVSVASAGLLVLIGGLVVGFGAPVFAALTSAVDRRLLLAACMALYVAGHALSALAPDFTTLAVLRAITIVSAAIFTPQAAATVGLIVPPERRAEAIAFIFIGWSAASVVGIPAGSLIASEFGWRAAYAMVAILSAVPLAMVWLAVRPGLKIQPLSFAAWKEALSNPVILCVLAVTLASASGQFTLVSYIAPFFKDSLAAGSGLIAVLFTIFGVAGVAGNTIASRFISKIGIDRAVLGAMLVMAAGTAILSLAFGAVIGCAAGLVVWGLGTFSGNSLQQSRLAAIAPALASASIALNTSVLYMGQAVGAALGGRLIADGITPALGWAATALMLVAAALSVAAARLAAVKPA
jgi:MFS transporter, DHA1 family, inner membrane transport protein